MLFKDSAKPGPIDSLIGAGTTVNGDLNFSGGLRIDGTVVGNISAFGDKPSQLVVSELARVEGSITVGNVVVNGTVVGPINAKDNLELLPKARVQGDVTYKQIEIHVGAVLIGRLNHETAAAAEKVVEFKAMSGV